MELAGYSFKVLDTAFTSHRGFSSVKSNPKFRSDQNKQNDKLFKGFIKDLEKRYRINPMEYLRKNKPKTSKASGKKRN